MVTATVPERCPDNPTAKCVWTQPGGNASTVTPGVGCRCRGREAWRDIGDYLMGYYNWQRPHQYNGSLARAESEKNLKLLSRNS
jgi:hypothetical protein